MSGQISKSSNHLKNSTKLCITEDVQTKRKKVTLFQQRNSSKNESLSKNTFDPLAYFKNIQLNNLIKQLKDKGGIERKKLLQLIDICQNIFQYESNVLRITSPVMIVGDIHGQFHDLLNIFNMNGFPIDKKFLFLGDYVDRGLFCVQVVTLLLVLKVKYQKNINMLRGNHEGKVMTINFNFRMQCEKKYGIEIYQRFIDLFCKFPLCAVIDDKYFAVHGGISPEIKQINELEKINRFVEIQNKGVICDLVWSDPSQNNTINWESNNMRGCSYFYSNIQAKRFLKDNKIKMIIRGHEVQIEGFNYQKSNTDEKLTLTIFSAPNYCDTYKNKGAVALINDNKVSIHRFSEVAHPLVLSNYMNGLEFTIPGICQMAGKIFLHLLKSKGKSRKSSIIDDKLLDELNALQRIQAITKFFQDKFLEHQEVLQKQSKKDILSLELANSYEIAYEVFLQKKTNDEDEMHPDGKVLSKLSLKKSVSRIGNKIQNVLIPLSPNIDNNQYEVFGPKLRMRNNIYKKSFCQEDSQLDELRNY